MNFKEYQEKGIEYMFEKRKCILADEMGLGKTIQTIGLLNRLQAKRVLIICPVIVKQNWKLELTRWLTYDIQINIIDSKKNPNVVEPAINIINYDIVKKFNLTFCYWDVIVLDEAHYIKNYKSQRTQHIKGDGRKKSAIEGEYKILLTGTPLTDHTINLYPMLTYIGFRMKFVDFTTKFCNRHEKFGHIDVSGSSNLPELKDVLRELPEKIRQAIYINSDNKTLKHLDKEFELSTSKQIEDIAEFAKLRQQTGLMKVPFCIELIKNALEEKEKIVVFAHHKEVISRLHAAFEKNSITLTGATEAKQEVIEIFAGDNNINVLIVSIKAGGIGVNLTIADLAIFIEMDMTPAINWQCEDRLHRIGQQNNVLIQYVVFEGYTVDKEILRIVNKKEKIIREVGL